MNGKQGESESGGIGTLKNQDSNRSIELDAKKVLSEGIQRARKHSCIMSFDTHIEVKYATIST